MSLINELKNYKQCDEDGVMCEVSRQAIDEAISYIEELEADRDQLVEWLQRCDSHVMELVEENEKLRKVLGVKV